VLLEESLELGHGALDVVVLGLGLLVSLELLQEQLLDGVGLGGRGTGQGAHGLHDGAGEHGGCCAHREGEARDESKHITANTHMQKGRVADGTFFAQNRSIAHKIKEISPRSFWPRYGDVLDAILSGIVTGAVI
jgi:hypothetical protein